jgi:hypothetical protein
MNTLMSDLGLAKNKLWEHVGFKEDWVLYAIDDRTDCFWRIIDDSSVRYAESKETLDDPEMTYYEDEIYTQRFYKKWVYRGKELTLIIVDTHTDGNRFFAIFDNSKED